MRVLVSHNVYQLPGGEDTVMQSEVELLRRHGHQIEVFLRHNDALEKASAARAAVQSMWSIPVAREFETQLRTFEPDVVHVHNTFPIMSPAIYWVADRLRIPVVQTLHNFRLLCPQAMFLRDGKVCEDCLGQVPWRGAMRGCYRDSKLQSTVLAAMITFHRAIGTWSSKITRYIALNEFCRQKFIAGGLPAEKISVKPNFVDFDAPTETNRHGFLFVGRLTEEKGASVLASATKLLPSKSIEVRVAGVGPDAKKLLGIAALTPLGTLNLEQIHQEMLHATALILPSICNESFPRTLVEAYGSGLPVIASRIGALAELVTEGITGLLFDPGNAQELADKMEWARLHPQEMAEMGHFARERYEAQFTAEHNYQQLIAIYEQAIGYKKKNIV